MDDLKYDFLSEAGRTINSLQSSTIFLTGNVHDHFNADGKYVPLSDFLKKKWDVPGKIIITYKLNSGIKFLHENQRKDFARIFSLWRSLEDDFFAEFDKLISEASVNPSMAMELLHQLCLCSAAKNTFGKEYLEDNLIIIIESAEMILPAEDLGSLSDADRMRIEICRDWFKDPVFMDSADVVVLVSESRSLVHTMLTRLPHVTEVEIPSPNEEVRAHFIDWFNENLPQDKKITLESGGSSLAKLTAGMSILALRGIMKNAVYRGGGITLDDVTHEVKKFIKQEIGDIVELKVPKHTLEDVAGFKDLKKFAIEKVIPRFRTTSKDALPGATICGPIGVGKTFFWEAIAAESDMIVLVLTGLRSKWFGESDVKLERLRRILSAFVNVIIFIDEADAQFTNLADRDQHETERRIQGGILAMMSDRSLRGNVKWLLITARVDKLSHDMLRPGRPGSLVIPMLDPEGQDRIDFIKWSVSPVLGNELTAEQLKQLEKKTDGYFAAMFSELRSELIAESGGKKMEFGKILDVIDEILHPAVKSTRKYQTLCALLYCNRRSLLPKGTDKEKVRDQLMEMKLRGLDRE
ncbi:MAG: AAA family ATPase [Acidobacteria bacterium]|nr:AAA family ATPase [Acidobacteriota bacterium]